MNKVYVVQNVVNTEIKLHECHLVTKVKAPQQDIKKLKLEIKSTKQKQMDSEANYQKISEVVALSCNKFEEEGITEEITPDAKIVQLVEIEEDLKKTVTEL